MKGNIYYIDGSFGHINGADGKEYFFRKNDLKNCTIYHLTEGDYVEFEIVEKPNLRYDHAVDIRKKRKENYKSPKRRIIFDTWRIGDTYCTQRI